MTEPTDPPSAAGLHALAALRLAEANGAGAAAAEARRALARLVPRYHAQVATDPVRLAAWDAALRALVRPGMHALEVGTGCGVLAMLAARAGAMVTACERDPVLAAIAQETVALNRLADAIRVLAKPAEALVIPADLPAPAELLFLDLFADNLFAFSPFEVLRAVRPLLAPGAAIVPARVALVGALADWPGWSRRMPGHVAGLDLSPLRALSPPDMGVAAAPLRSDPAALLEVDLAGDLPAGEGDAAHVFESHGGPVNGVLLWLRLDLAPGIRLEADPAERERAFYARARFHPFAAVRETVPGERLPVRLAWRGRRVSAAPA